MPETALVVESHLLRIEPLPRVHPALAARTVVESAACAGCFPLLPGSGSFRQAWQTLPAAARV
jgi:hypothetical protein